MRETEMTVDSIRDFCLAFPQAKESLQWGETLCFKIGGKIFAMLSLDSVPPSICFKTTPERFAELVEIEGIVPAPYVGRYKWVLLEHLDALPASELEDFIGQSYTMVMAKIPKPKSMSKKRKSRKPAKKSVKKKTARKD